MGQRFNIRVFTNIVIEAYSIGVVEIQIKGIRYLTQFYTNVLSVDKLQIKQSLIKCIQRHTVKMSIIEIIYGKTKKYTKTAVFHY